MKVLIACEESQVICKEFRKLNVEAYSCDLYYCSGGLPEYHIQQDVIPLLDGNCKFITCDGKQHEIIGKWDLLIAHPVCTYLTVAGNRWFNVEKYGEKAKKRYEKRKEAAEFFMKFVNADCNHICIENPVGYMNTHWRKASQIIQPWMWLPNTESKTTCLWLKGLPKLVPDRTVKPPEEYYEWVNKQGIKKREPLWYFNALHVKSNEERSKIRSRTFEGIGRAIATQWTDYLIYKG